MQLFSNLYSIKLAPVLGFCNPRLKPPTAGCLAQEPEELVLGDRHILSWAVILFGLHASKAFRWCPTQGWRVVLLVVLREHKLLGSRSAFCPHLVCRPPRRSWRFLSRRQSTSQLPCGKKWSIVNFAIPCAEERVGGARSDPWSCLNCLFTMKVET